MALSVIQEYIVQAMKILDESNIVITRTIYSCITRKQSDTIISLLSTSEITAFVLPQ